VLDPEGFPFRPGFNLPPYNLGTYDTIASYKGGRFGRAPHFSLGYKYDLIKPRTPHTVNAKYVQRDGQAEVSALTVEGKKVKIEIHIAKQKSEIIVTEVDTGKKYSESISEEFIAGRASIINLSGFYGFCIIEKAK
jgi:hypothetical protein